MPDEPNSPIEEEVEEVLDEVDAIEETLAFHAITSELRHEQILEGIAECRERLESLSTQFQTSQGESPANSRISQELAEIRTMVTDLREKQMMSSSPNPQPSQSPPSNPAPGGGAVDPQEHAPATTPVPRKRRFVKI